METLKIGGETFNVIERKSIAALGETLPRLALDYADRGIIAQLMVKRPRGKRMALVLQGTDGSYTVGAWA